MSLGDYTCVAQDLSGSMAKPLKKAEFVPKLTTLSPLSQTSWLHSNEAGYRPVAIS